MLKGYVGVLLEAGTKKLSRTSGRFGRSSPRSKPVGKSRKPVAWKSKDHKQNRFSHYSFE